MKTGPIALEKRELRVGDTTGTMVQARLRVLGRFSLELAHVTAPSLATQKARAILAYLFAHRQADIARERLLEVFWPEAQPAAAKDGLRSALWTIRRSVKDAGFEPNHFVVANRAIIRWTADSWYDAEAFVELAKSEDPIDLEAALALYQGDFIEGDYEEWTVAERARLADAYEAVLARLVRIAQSREAAQVLIGRNPYDEASYHLLIKDEISAGRIVAAAALADRCERALAEIGAQPSLELQRLLASIAKHELHAATNLVLPFVGRAGELSTVRSYLQARLGAKLLVVSGEAGIGKSTFLAHIIALARDFGLRAVTVQCFDTDSRLFGPFEELYAQLHGEPFNPLASSQAPPAQRLAEALFDALDPTVVLCIDDAHTLTSDAWLVLCAVARCASVTQRTLIIATRTEGLKNVSAAVNGCTLETIVLGPLHFEELHAAIDSVVTDDDATVARTVFERSGGHPLFAVTLLDSLVQSGILRSELGTWRLCAALDEQISLPKTLKTYIEARLHARGDIASTVAAALSLEAAATADDLAAVLDMPEEKLFSAFDDLLSLGVLVQTDAAPQLSFAHDLYREVAARTLNPGRRVRLHRAFGERFLSLSTADSSLRSARHLALAGDAMRAADAYARAATEALECRAALEARDRCTAGIAGLENLEGSPQVDAMLARLKMLLAKAHAALGHSHAAKTSANESIALARRVGEAGIAIQAALARQSVIRDEYDAASSLVSAREIEIMSADTHDDASLAVALADQSWAHRLLGSASEAIKTARESERIAASTDDADVISYALEQTILAAITWWRFDEAVEAASRCRGMMMRAGRVARSMLQCALTCLHFALEDHSEASSTLAAAIMLFEEDDRDAGRVAMHELFSRTRLRLALAAISAQLALSDGDVQRALNAAEQLAKLASPRARQLAEIFRVEALFGTESIAPPFDATPFTDSALVFLQDVFSGSRGPAISQALQCSISGATDTAERLLEALDRIEACSRRTPLDADRAFAQLSRAAERCDAHSVAVRATLRRKDYGTARALARSRVSIFHRFDSKNA